MSNYIPSVNIESGISQDFQYIVTQNVQAVLGQLISSYQSGHHSFTVIGTYGTGKSSFLMALERDLSTTTTSLVEVKDAFVKGIKKYEFLNVLGDYQALSTLLGTKVGCEHCYDSRNVISALNHYYKKVEKAGKMLIIVVDEFGKILEHAAKVDPETELYFLQVLSEFCNDGKRNILLLTTLHQNFGTYGQKLDQVQRQEWNKVKGRFKEVVFIEPIEQLLYMASRKLGDSNKAVCDKDSFLDLLNFAKESKFVNEKLSKEIALNLYPLDPFAANCLTQSIQRYGQNERTLFSFLTAKGPNSISEFKPSKNETFNLSKVYDYITYTFYSSLSQANADTMSWSAMKESLDRVESGIFDLSIVEDARRMVKAIGLMNLFGGSAVSISKTILTSYASKAMSIQNPELILSKLEQFKIVRYAEYKHQYILFEGTDIDIESALLSAGTKVALPTANVQKLSEYIDLRVISAVAEYYKKGTPRYFEFMAENEPSAVTAKDDIDGYIHLVFPLQGMTLEKVKAVSKTNENADIYVFFNNVDTLLKHLHQIKKLQYLLDNVVLEDRVAKREVSNLLDYEKHLLNESINSGIIAGDNQVTWIFKGETNHVACAGDLKKLLSHVCEVVYSKTPVMRNELFNKQKVNSVISCARCNLMKSILDNVEKEDLGFDSNSFPPEKTIYYSLLKNTGIHRKDKTGLYSLGAPTQPEMKELWMASERFLSTTQEKPRKLGEYIKILKSAPFKMKQGFIDFWLPLFLLIKQQDFALYNGDGAYVMNINEEVLDLLQKHPNEFAVKAFNVSGVRLEYFRQYRSFLKQDTDVELSNKSFSQTFKPFLSFYKKNLNEYAKTTRKFERATTAKFRDALASAQDPEKTFFEDLPAALGFDNNELHSNDEFSKDYLSLIQQAVHELVICYDRFIDRIESRVVSAIDLPSGFEEYKRAIETRYNLVKKHLLTQRSRTFLDRILAPSANKKEFWEKVGNAVLDKRLEQTKDKEEDRLIEELIYLFRELDRYVDISRIEGKPEDEVLSFEMASTNGNIHRQKTYRLTSGQKERAATVEQKILSQLTGDDNLDVCILLRMLNAKLSKK